MFISLVFLSTVVEVWLWGTSCLWDRKIFPSHIQARKEVKVGSCVSFWENSPLKGREFWFFQEDHSWQEMVSQEIEFSVRTKSILKVERSVIRQIHNYRIKSVFLGLLLPCVEEINSGRITTKTKSWQVCELDQGWEPCYLKFCSQKSQR